MKNVAGSNSFGAAASLNENHAGFRQPETLKVNMPVYVHIDNAQMENRKEEDSTLILRNRLFQRGVGKYSVTISRDEPQKEHERQASLSKRNGEQPRATSNNSRHKRAESAHEQSDGYYLPSLTNHASLAAESKFNKSLGFHKRNQSSDRTANSKILKSTVAINLDATNSFTKPAKQNNVSINHDAEESIIAHTENPGKMQGGPPKSAKQPYRLTQQAAKPIVLNKFRTLNTLPNIINKGSSLSGKDQAQKDEIDLLLKEIDGENNNNLSKSIIRTGGGFPRSKGYFDIHPAVPNILQEDIANSDQVKKISNN